MSRSSAVRRGLHPLTRVLLVLALAVPTLPMAAPAARADGGLDIAAKTIYTVDAESGRLHVSIEYTVTNTTPSTTSGGVITRYYYDRYGLVIPDESEDLRATNQFGSLRVSDEILELEDGSEGRVATIHMGSIFYRQSRSFTFSFAIPGGEPRSESGARVNPAYTAFWVTAFGDPDMSEVEIRLPADFEVTTYGDFVERTDTEDEIVLAEDDIADPYEWGVFISGRRDDSLGSTVVDLGELDVEVRAWPGDHHWADRVEDVVRTGLPQLQQLVGLEYHVDSLVFLETLDPSLVGYAGWYLVGEDRIEMGEHLDDHIILHEMAHLWFNQDLFIDRWINEGLADTFAAQAVIAIDGESDTAYTRALIPVPSLSVAVPLNDWDVPRSSSAGNDEIQRREEYGYNASYFVVLELYEEIGADGLGLVFVTAVADEIAYQGPGEPETVNPTDSWRRFLDILEEIAGSERAEELFRKYVVADRDMARLDHRAEARAAYRAHLAEAGEWAPPWALREPMSEWEFDRALTALEAAGAVIDMRESLEALAVELGLDSPDSLETAYESSMDGAQFDEAAALGAAQLEALQHVAEVRAAVDEPRGFFTRIGLMGQDPEVEWTEAADLYEMDDLEGAHTEAQQALDLLADAERVGQQRVMWAGAGAAGFLLVTTGGTWMLIRRRRRRRSPAGDIEAVLDSILLDQAGGADDEAPSA